MLKANIKKNTVQFKGDQRTITTEFAVLIFEWLNLVMEEHPDIIIDTYMDLAEIMAASAAMLKKAHGIDVLDTSTKRMEDAHIKTGLITHLFNNSKTMSEKEDN